MENDKIAVHCTTEEEWNAVRIKINKTDVTNWQSASRYGDVCIYVGGDGGFDRKDDCLLGGWKVITAEEYLGISSLIAVECLSKKIWDTVQRRMLDKGNNWMDSSNTDNNGLKDLFEERHSCCLTEQGLNGMLQTSSKDFWIDKGYKNNICRRIPRSIKKS